LNSGSKKHQISHDFSHIMTITNTSGIEQNINNREKH